jgi:opacity protein-like surface antigen
VSPLASHSVKYHASMRIPLAHRLIFMVAAVTLFAPQLVAQTVGNLYGGYSFLSNDLHVEKNIGGSGAPSASGRGNLNGWNVSAEVKVFRWIGAVADFDGSYGSVPVTGFSPFFFNHPTHSNTSFYSYLFGPRVSVELGKFRPFAEALFGVASQNVDFDQFESAHDTHFATAYGGGLDYRVTGRFAWRLQADYVGSRLFPRLQPFPNSKPVQHNLRFSTGLVFRL